MSARPLARPSRAGTPAGRPRDRLASGRCCGPPGGSGRGARGPREGRISLARAPRAAVATVRQVAVGRLEPAQQTLHGVVEGEHDRCFRVRGRQPGKRLRERCPVTRASRVSRWPAGSTTRRQPRPAGPGDGHEGIRVLEHICADDASGSQATPPRGRAPAETRTRVKSPPNMSAATPSALRRARATFGSPRSIGVVKRAVTFPPRAQNSATKAASSCHPTNVCRRRLQRGAIPARGTHSSQAPPRPELRRCRSDRRSRRGAAG